LSSGLSPITPEELVAAMVSLGVDVARNDPRHWVTRTVDVDRDGAYEVAVTGVEPDYCGSGGCSLWVFKKTSNGLRDLLPTTRDVVKGFGVEVPVGDGPLTVLGFERDIANDQLSCTVYTWQGSSYSVSERRALGPYWTTPLPPTAIAAAPTP
jgi:hypothetical protein